MGFLLELNVAWFHFLASRPEVAWTGREIVLFVPKDPLSCDFAAITRKRGVGNSPYTMSLLGQEKVVTFQPRRFIYSVIRFW